MNRFSQHQKRGIIKTTIGLFVLLSCLRAWFVGLPVASEALGQIPDSGLQRKELLEEARRTNQLLTEIHQALTSGTLNVRLQGADNKPGVPPIARDIGQDR